MKILDLFESPIADWSVDPDLDKNEKSMIGKFHGYSQEQLHWSPQDKAAMTSEKHVNKIKKAFLKTPFDINLYFWQSNDPNYDRFSQKGSVTPAWIQHQMGDNVMDYIDKTFTADSITIIMTNNLSDEHKIGINSPWILAHRMAHTMVAGAKSQISGKQLLNIFLSYVEIICNKVYGYEFNDWHHSIRSDEIHIYGKILGEYLGTMSSARNKKLVNVYEWIYESFTQYLITGKVTFNTTLPEVFDDPLQATPEKLALGLKIIKRFENTVNTKCQEIIDQSMGKIFVM